MEMSNPKGQRLESAFPIPRGLSCFSWAMHTPVRTSLYLHICVYSGACGAESRQSKGALGQALCQRPAAALVPWDLWPRQTGPCFCRWRAEVHVTDTPQNWLRKLVKDWTQQLSSKECRASHRATSPDHCLLPSGGICTWPRRACLVKAQMRRSLSSSDSHKGCACAGRWAGDRAVPAVQAKETLCWLFFPAPAASTISSWLTPGSTNHNKWLQSCPFWHTTRALLLNAETRHSQENYPKPKTEHEFKVNLLKIHKFPVRTDLELQWCYFSEC